MKKLLALLLCLIMGLSMSAAVAEEVSTIEMVFDGVWVQFEDGFEFYLPAEWVEYELTEEQNAQGIFYAAGSADGTDLATVSWQPLEKETTIEEAQTILAGVYADAKLVQVNDVGLVAYSDTVNNILNCVAMDATEPGMYIFSFYPGDDEAFQNLAALIASSIRNF